MVGDKNDGVGTNFTESTFAVSTFSSSVWAIETENKPHINIDSRENL
jgi:hypothetical protein